MNVALTSMSRRLTTCVFGCPIPALVAGVGTFESCRDK